MLTAALLRRADLQALGVVWITSGASSSSNTLRRSSPAPSTTLSPLRHRPASWWRNNGAGWWLDRRSSGSWWPDRGNNGRNRWRHNNAAVKSRADRSELNIGECDRGVREVALDVLGLADLGVTWAADGSWLGAADWVSRIEPLHVGGVVVPDGHGEDHRTIKSLGEPAHAAGLGEVVQVPKGSLLLFAEVIGDLVSRVNTSNVRNSVSKDNAVLDVEAANRLEGSGGGVIRSDELGDNCDLLVGVDLLARAEEGSVAHAVRVEVTSILVTDASVSVVCVTAVGTGAAREAVALAGVRSVGGGVLVGLPDVHLGTAGSVAAGTGVWIVRSRLPVEDVGLRVC